ncbi:MAG: M1 family metallopeptidase [Planctomycetes bacterium]|nr:M1 family metallopeptidase [Planctomycetota bacterium]
MHSKRKSTEAQSFAPRGPHGNIRGGYAPAPMATPPSRSPAPVRGPAAVLALALATGQFLGACRSSPAPAIPPERFHGPRQADVDVEHTALWIELDPRERSMTATARVRLCSRVEGLSLVRLDLADLAVREVRDQDGGRLDFRHADDVLGVELARPLARGEFQELSIDYGGRPRRGLSFEDLEDGVATQVFTQGECEDSRGWFPCLDFPAERATSEIAVVMPAGWTSLAAGERVERRELEGGRALERWRMSTPHPAYLTTLVAGDFAVRHDVWDGIPLLYLADPDLAPHIESRFRETPAILEFLSRLTGVRYPYAKYGQAVVADFPFGGMENISATTLTDAWLTDERGSRDEPAFGLIAHEAAHQWFGNLLTCADWSHIWLNEGWATYATELYVEAAQGREAFEISMANTREGYLRLDVGPARRPIVHGVYREPMDLFVTGHVYPGAASRLHQLRFELGDPAFFAGVRRYVALHRGTAVDTDDFRKAMEAESGRDLGPFFAQWFFGPGHPELSTRWRWIEETGEAELSVEQTQAQGGGVPEAFSMDAEVELGRGGEPPRLERVTLDARRQVFRWKCDSKPRWVILDPHGWLVARRTDEREGAEWLRVALEAPHPLARRDAVQALANLALESSTPRGRLLYAQALEGLLAADASPEVRAGAARALSRLAPEFGQEALRAAAASDSSTLVRVAALRGLALFPAGESLATFGREQFLAGESWQTLVAAHELEMHARPDPAVWLERFGRPSPHGVLQAGLVASLFDVLDQDAAVALLGRTLDRPETPPLVVEAVLRRLGPLAKDRAQCRAWIEARLQDPEYRVRSAALESLAAAQDPRCVPAVRRAYGSYVEPRQRRAAEKILQAPWASRP